MEFVVGRQASPPSADLLVGSKSNTAISRRQVRIDYQSGATALLTDLSSNGTFVIRIGVKKIGAREAIELDETIYFGAEEFAYTVRELIDKYQELVASKEASSHPRSRKPTKLIDLDRVDTTVSTDIHEDKTIRQSFFRDPVTGEITKQ